MIRSASVLEKLSDGVFSAVHNNNLIHNTCWEDPAQDRVALNCQPDDRLLVITSAGCNALDYLLAGAGEVIAVDVNPRQNALLELKVAALRGLDHDTLFALFGTGSCRQARVLYHDALRGRLTPAARQYWDRHISLFEGSGWRGSFDYRGAAGLFAKLVMVQACTLQRLHKPIEALLAAETVEEQRAIYEAHIQARLWTPFAHWFLSRPATLSLIGVPWPQRHEIVTQYPGGLVQFIRDSFEAVVTRLPLATNYFWRVYMQGCYSHTCCPEYLKRANLDRLRSGLLDRLTIRTASVTDYLRRAEPGISKFVLLDHMDWMSWHQPQALADEWQAILDKARPAARVIFRSAGLQVRYLDHLSVRFRNRPTRLGDLLRYHPELAAELHARDRVHTYGCFSIADLPA